MRIKCDGAKCFITEIERLASGAINYFTAKFNFDNAWAIFIDANQLYGVFEGSDMVVISNLAYNAETQTYDCEIPWQVITQEGELHVGAIGHITTPETIILTTNMAFAYRVPKGAATNASTGSQPSGLLLEVLEAAEETEANADRAEAAVNHFPYIDPTTNNWFKWDVATGVFIDTGVDATGPAAGFGTPTISVIQGAEGTQPQVTINATGPNTAKIFDFDFTLPKGNTGTAAEITIGTTETGAPGTDALVTNSGDEHFAVLHFTIPEGLTGASGLDGVSVVSIIKTNTVGLVDTYTITFSNATTTTFTVTNGAKGDTGEDFVVIGHYNTLAALQTAVPNPSIGDVYSIGTVIPYNIYLYDGITHAWIDYGTIQGPTGTTGPTGAIGATGAAGADASIDIVRW